MKKRALVTALAGAVVASAVPALAAGPSISGSTTFTLSTPLWGDTKVTPSQSQSWSYALKATVDNAWNLDMRFNSSGSPFGGTVSGFRIDHSGNGFKLIAAYKRSGSGSDNTVATMGDWVGILPISNPESVLRLTTTQYGVDWVLQAGNDGVYARGTGKIGNYTAAVTVRNHMNTGDDKYTLGTYAVVPVGSFTIYPGFGFSTESATTQNTRFHVYAKGKLAENLDVDGWLQKQDVKWGNLTYYNASATYVQDNALRLKGIYSHWGNAANDSSVKNDNKLEGSVVWRADSSIDWDKSFVLSGTDAEVYTKATGLGAKVSYWVQQDQAKPVSDRQDRLEAYVTGPVVANVAWGRGAFIRVTNEAKNQGDVYNSSTTKNKTYTLAQGYVKLNDKTVWRPSVTHVTLSESATDADYKYSRVAVANSVSYTLSSRTTLTGGVTLTSADDNGTKKQVSDVTAGLTYKTSDNAVLSLSAGRNQVDNAAPTGNLTASVTLKF